MAVLWQRSVQAPVRDVIGSATVTAVEAVNRHPIREAGRVIASDASILDALALALSRSPVPRPSEDLADELVEMGLDMGTDPEDRLYGAIQDDSRFAPARDGMVFLPALLEGTRWTAAVEAEHAQEDFVRLDVDLGILIWWLIVDEVSLIDDEGGELGLLEVDGIDVDGADTDVLFGPAGWLEPFAGRLAIIEVVGGALRLSACEQEPSPTTRQVDAIRSGFERAARTESYSDVMADEPVELTFAMGEAVTIEALVADRGAFVDEQPPRHNALLEAAGLQRRGPIVAAADFDWDMLSSWQRRNGLKWESKLGDEETDFLSMLVGASEMFVAGDPQALGDDAEQRTAVTGLLTSILEEFDGVAWAFWEYMARRVPVTETLRFADALAEALGEATSSGATSGEASAESVSVSVGAGEGDGVATAGVAWLRSRCLDELGRVPEAIAALDAVVSDTDHPLVLIDAAGFAADRGDAPAARRLLERSGALEHLADHDGEFTHSAPDLDLLAEVLPYAQRPKAAVGRNDACPCGSGRKYKVCHLGKEQHPLDARAGWLYGKAVRFLRRVDPSAMEGIAAEMASLAGRETREELADSLPAADIALHEGGGFVDFLADRSDLLPADEALLATQWTLVDRGVFEVENSGPDWVELLDIGRGDRVTVTNVDHERKLPPGTLLLGRPLPVGETYRSFGGFLPLPRSALDAMLEAIAENDPLGIATVFAATLAPPRLSNTDGEPIVFHELSWRIGGDGQPDVAAVDASLREAGLDRNDGDDPPRWTLVRDSANQPRTNIATLRLEDDVLVVEVNSDERAEEIALLIDEALPTATYIGEESRPVEEMMRDHDPSSTPPMPPTEPDMNDPAIREAVMKMMHEYEERWIDDSIPALGGRSPREAVKDPVGREEVVQLIATFPDLDEMDGIGMDPDRIRSLLGL